MAFRNGLFPVDPVSASPWSMYALATLIRIASYNTRQLVIDWNTWAGGMTSELFPATSLITSAAVGVSDNTTAIVAFQGTRNVSQLAGQIVLAAPISQPRIFGRASSFHYWSTLQRLTAIQTWLAQPPAVTNVFLAGHSLGGAVAAVTSGIFRRAGTPTVRGVFTTGQPRSGDQPFVNSIGTPYVRLVNSGDPIAATPPDAAATNILGTLANVATDIFQWRHGGVNWTITEQPSLALGQEATLLGTAFAYANATMQGPGFQQQILQTHDINNYVRILRSLATVQLGAPPLATLNTLNDRMNAIDSTPQAPVFPQTRVPVTAVFAAPNIIIPPAPSNPQLPPEDLGQLISNLSLNLPQPVQPQANPILLFQGGSMTWKITFFYIQRNFGWTETYYIQADSLSAARVKAEDLGPKLSALRGATVSIIKFRVAQVAVPAVYPKPRNAQLFDPPTPWIGAASITGQTDGDFSDTCILLRCYPLVSPAGAKFIFMRGIPDAFVVAGGAPVAGGMTAFGAAWTSLLTEWGGGGWGWIGKAVDASVKTLALTSLVQNANGTVTFTTATDLFPNTVPIGDNVSVPVTFKGITVPGNLNGTNPVTVGATRAGGTTVRSIAILGWSNDGKVQYAPQRFVRFQAYAPGAAPPTYPAALDRIGERKAGRPFAPPRGRQKNRVRA